MYLKYLFFYIKKLQFLKFVYKNGNLKKILKTKSHPNIHQNVPNCTILKYFSGGMPPNPLAKHIQISKSEKNISWPNYSLPNPGDALQSDHII